MSIIENTLCFRNQKLYYALLDILDFRGKSEIACAIRWQMATSREINIPIILEGEYCPPEPDTRSGPGLCECIEDFSITAWGMEISHIIYNHAPNIYENLEEYMYEQLR